MNLFPSRGGWPFTGPPNCDFELNTNSPQAQGLVGWWPTLGARGWVMPDRSGHGMSGTFQNTGTWSTPWAVNRTLGWMVDYPASTGDRYIALPGNILSSDVYSVSLWFITDEIDAFRDSVSCDFGIRWFFLSVLFERSAIWHQQYDPLFHVFGSGSNWREDGWQW